MGPLQAVMRCTAQVLLVNVSCGRSGFFEPMEQHEKGWWTGSHPQQSSYPLGLGHILVGIFKTQASPASVTAAAQAAQPAVWAGPGQQLSLSIRRHGIQLPRQRPVGSVSQNSLAITTNRNSVAAHSQSSSSRRDWPSSSSTQAFLSAGQQCQGQLLLWLCPAVQNRPQHPSVMQTAVAAGSGGWPQQGSGTRSASLAPCLTLVLLLSPHHSLPQALAVPPLPSVTCAAL